MDCRSSVVAQALVVEQRLPNGGRNTPRWFALAWFSRNPPRCYRGELTLVNPGTYHYRYRTRGKRRTAASQSLSLKRRNNRRCNPCEPGAWDGLEESEFEEYSRGNGEKKERRQAGPITVGSSSRFLATKTFDGMFQQQCVLFILELISSSFQPASPSRRLTENLEVSANKGRHHDWAN